ncbi:hypothetical protein FIBSPDRAFT_1053519 [Athelia psychrophila]|uniref:Uncharacterized protein n=1 Tax=Athelia psychrophila TaxID=1759441 RepID=A0A167WUL5_9AGAM|nr:hypothetical protein FIBSPDRAFT_1053519 [Fibularhizoctonia sp. CBS 109695]
MASLEKTMTELRSGDARHLPSSADADGTDIFPDRHRLLVVFANRATADEWWRAVSTSPHAAHVKRSSPQFYSYDAVRYNLLTFFQGDARFDPLAGQFRGRMWFNVMPNSDIPGISVIPPVQITDHISGNWFYIRSASNHALHWYYNSAHSTRFNISHRRGTKIRVVIRDMPAGTIMVASDLVTLQIGAEAHIDVQVSGHLGLTGGHPPVFLFGDLENGKFSASADDALVYVGTDSPSSPRERWELA